MKTEPTEARCHIMTRSFGNGYGDEIMVREDAEEAVNMAFKEGQSSPKIKQLEWMENSSRYFAGSPVGDYTILRVPNFDEKELWRLYFNGRIMQNKTKPNPQHKLTLRNVLKSVWNKQRLIS